MILYVGPRYVLILACGVAPEQNRKRVRILHSITVHSSSLDCCR